MVGTTRLKSVEADSLLVAEAVMLAAEEADADMEAAAEIEADSIADKDRI